MIKVYRKVRLSGSVYLRLNLYGNALRLIPITSDFFFLKKFPKRCSFIFIPGLLTKEYKKTE